MSKPLGFWSLTALVAGNMIGAGVFLVPSALASFGDDGLIAWALTAMGALLLALVFARLSARTTKSGGPYVFCKEAFGNFIGFEVAFNYWVAAWIGNAAVCVAFVGYLGFFFPRLGHDPVARFFIEMLFVWGFTFINLLGIRAAALVQVVTTALKIIPLILLIVLGFFFLHPEHFSRMNLPQANNFAAINAAATIALWSFVGLESATVPAESAVDSKTIARATIVGTLGVTALYLLSAIAVVGLIPYQNLQHSTSPYADAAGLAFQQAAQFFHIHFVSANLWGGGLIAVGAMIAAAGSLNGWVLMQALVPLAAARDGLFPKIFGWTNARGVPVYGLALSAVTISLLLTLTLRQALVKQFTFIVLLATLGQLIAYFFTCMAEIKFFLKERAKFNLPNFVKSFILMSCATAYAFWAIVGAGQNVIAYGMLLFLAGVSMYVVL